ncbi:MAG: nucleotidyltransferase domain-containing protein [Tepidiformaceae bacterium]
MLKPAAVLKAEAEEEHRLVLEAARRFADRVVAEFGAEAVYLFGSRARNDWHRGSDCDVIVVASCFEGTVSFERPVKMYRLWDGPGGIEPVVVTPAEFENAKGKRGLIDMALQSGVMTLHGSEPVAG